MSDLVLPVVDGWPSPPAVTVPLYELSEWAGPRWLVLWDGNKSDGLRLVHLLFGDPETKRPAVELISYAKQPAKDLGDGVGVMATSLGEVADGVLIHLLDRLSERLPQEARSSWERERRQNVVAATEHAPSTDALIWSAAIIEVEHQQVAGYRLTVDDGWAICLDAGEVFVGLFGVQHYEPALTRVTDLQRYPMPDDENHPVSDPPDENEPEWDPTSGRVDVCHWAGLASDSPEEPPFLVKCECGRLFKGPYPTLEEAQNAFDSHLDHQPFEFPPAENIVVKPPSAERVAGWADFPRAGRSDPPAAGLRQIGLGEVVNSRQPMVGVIALPITEIAQRLGVRTDRLSDEKFSYDAAYFEVERDAFFIRQWTVEVVTEVYAYVVPTADGSHAGREEMRRFMTLAGLSDKQVLLPPEAATGHPGTPTL
jgi:hypothetical protein